MAKTTGAINVDSTKINAATKEIEDELKKIEGEHKKLLKNREAMEKNAWSGQKASKFYTQLEKNIEKSMSIIKSMRNTNNYLKYMAKFASKN